MDDAQHDRVDQWMQRNLETVSEKTSAMAAAAHMAERRIGCVLVTAEPESSASPGQIVGLVSETDLVRKVMAQELAADAIPIDRLMASPLLSIEAERSMLDASHLMERHGIRHLCVSQNGTIVGLISVRDLVRYFMAAESGPVRDLDDVYRPLSVLMRTQIETIDEEATLREAAQRMHDKRIGALMVRRNGEMVGIVTERDLIHRAMAKGLDPTSTRVSAVMTHPLIAIDINRTVRDASDMMAENGIRHLPVMDRHRIVGILSVRDLIRMVSVRDRPRFLRQASASDKT